MTQVLRAFSFSFPPLFYFFGDLFRRYIQPADPGGLSSDGRFPPCQKASPLSLRGTNDDDDSITVSRGVAPGGQAMRHEPRSGTCYIITVTVPPPSRRISIHPSIPSIHPPVLPLVLMLLLLLLLVAPSVEADSAACFRLYIQLLLSIINIIIIIINALKLDLPI